MKFFLVLLSLSLFTSCAKVGYVLEQGFGQLDLLASGISNQTLIQDDGTPDEIKQKILLVERYKDYFYSYLQEKPSKIYTKTVLLKEKAVTHLVIVSPKNQIKALEECFPVAGCFPYLGFYKLKSAHRYAEKMEERGNVTFLRPVYAYSTLGKFNDPILSSFFEYDDVGLAELIFHELFHTVFFIKNEVQLNENLANFFAHEMVNLYFSDKKDLLNKYERQNKISKVLTAYFVKASKELNQRYKEQNNSDSQKILDNFLSSEFIPKVHSICLDFKIALDNCKPAKESWNNARFAAMLTYEEEGVFFQEDFKASKLDLLEYIKSLKTAYQEFEAQKKIKNFMEYYKGLK